MLVKEYYIYKVYLYKFILTIKFKVIILFIGFLICFLLLERPLKALWEYEYFDTSPAEENYNKHIMYPTITVKLFDIYMN